MFFSRPNLEDIPCEETASPQNQPHPQPQPQPQPTSPPMSVQQKSTVTAGPEFLSFQDAIIGVHTPTSSKMASQKTDEVFDIHLLPCSCFSFMSIFNKQKLL